MIVTDVNQVIYQGNGQTTQFSYPFKIVDKTDIKLIRVDSVGNETAVTNDYYIDTVAAKVHYPGYAPGTSVAEADMPAVLAAGEQLVIYRKVPITQLSEIDSHWPFNVIESGLDKLTMICQQLSNVFSRCLKVSEAHPNFDSTIPVQPNKAIEINSAGTGFTLADAPSEVRAQCLVIKGEAETARDTAQAYRDTAQVYMNSAGAYASSASTSANNAAASVVAAKAWKDAAEDQAEEAARQATYCTAMAAEGALYDAEHAYEPGDACMTPEGNLWRCIANSTGENPSTSAKWVLVSIVNNNTFEPDENGDLMPLMYPKQSSQFDIDENGDIEPAL